jgi:hypothetical protein
MEKRRASCSQLEARHAQALSLVTLKGSYLINTAAGRNYTPSKHSHFLASKHAGKGGKISQKQAYSKQKSLQNCITLVTARENESTAKITIYIICRPICGQIRYFGI